MDRLDQLFQQFLRERTYINNVTVSTTEYESAWRAFKASQANAPARPASAPLISKADLQHFVVHLRQRGIKPVSCNTWLRALNAVCRWLGTESTRYAEPTLRALGNSWLLRRPPQPPAEGTLLNRSRCWSSTFL